MPISNPYIVITISNTMSKSYVKDPNGKYRLVDKQEPQAQTQTLTLEELDARLKRVERIVIDPRK